MELAPAGVPLTFEVTFDSGALYVGMSVYDDSGSSPVLVQGPLAMSNVVANTYRGHFTAVAGKNYIIVKGVYTDNTYTVLSSNYAQGSESITAMVIGSGGSSNDGCPITGFLEQSQAVVGYLNLNTEIVGFVSCES